MAFPRAAARAASAGLALAALVACTGDPAGEPPPAASADAAIGTPAAATPDPARPGVLLYDGYAAAVAAEGETVRELAARTGLPAAALASYNGLRETSTLHEGDELVLPPEG